MRAKLSAVVGEVISGRYELEELIGRGGMSSVYRAHDRLLERTVALKLLHDQYAADPDYVERFRREARSVAQLSHANIVTVIDRGEDDGRQFIVFEYVEGESLKDLVGRRGPLPLRQALELGLQIAGALAFAHRQGLVHRDVKPQNILLAGSGPAKVTDFGIARAMTVEGLTQTGTVLGTSDYIAPEQARGEEVDERTDVYALGVVMYELLTGEVPFSGDNFVTVALRHMNERPTSLRERRPEVPLRLDGAVQRALAKDPASRFPSMDDFIAELRACLAELSAPRHGASEEEAATVVVPSPVQRRPRSRRRWPWLVGAAALLAAAVAAAFVLRSGSDRGATGERQSAGSIPVDGAGVYDPPPGDGHEHDDLVPRATDGNAATYWTTEHYRSFEKKGVGLVLELPGSRRPKQVTMTTDTPGFTARIEAGDDRGGPFSGASPSRTVGRTTTFDLNDGASGRYLVVWITHLADDAAHVNEVTARA